jgi:tetratricopeptide (TPR) repeat protein
MALVHEGWDHLRARRPLAAWGSWQRAVRLDPGLTAALQALATLESAADLPEAARSVYHLRQPDDPARRAAWDDRLKALAGEHEDLAVMADAFGRLAAETPSDPAAWYNRALCMAWLGSNREAITCLDRVTELEARPAFDRAVAAWTLAEILRQGEGAEALADDLRFACILAWEPQDTPELLDEVPDLQRVPTPHVPGIEPGLVSDIEVFEWLDRRIPGSDEAANLARAVDLPVVLASVYVARSARTLRLSSPRIETLQQVEELLLARIEVGHRSIRREASPLPLPFLDADVWTVRIPPGLEPAHVDRLMRECIEHYYEDEWIHRVRHGLGGLSPLAAAREGRRGDPILLAKLAAVVRFREQLGRRPSALRLYQGYPFDRLRRRLGLEPSDPVATDPSDLSCASPSELDGLDPASLDDHRLVEAVASAVGLRDDARTATLTAELIRRRPREAAALDLAAAVSSLVRRDYGSGDFDAALRWIDQARPLCDARTTAILDTWRAEILARAGRPDEALTAYRNLIRAESPADGAALALDGAETLLDNGHVDQARSILLTARDLARSAGRRGIERRAKEILDRSWIHPG